MRKLQTSAQRFILDNKQAPLFTLCFCVLSVVFIYSLFSFIHSQYSFASNIQIKQLESESLRDILRNDMGEKQKLKKQIADAQVLHDETLKSLSKQKEELSENAREIEDLQARINSFQKRLEDVQKKLSEPEVAELKEEFGVLTQPLVINVPVPEDSVEFRRAAVKNGFLHAWNSYKKYAWGKDELKPKSKTATDWLSLGVTIVDALDTLWIMGLAEEFQQARDWVDKHLTFDINREVSFFETTIRELGGLLSAFELSKDRMFLRKAEDLGKRLLKGFGNSNIPYASVNLKTGAAKSPSWTGGASILSEIGTLQLEFLYLAYHTRDASYAEKPMQVFKHLDNLTKPKPGLYPLYVLPSNGAFKGNDYSIGALGDSFYEYMIKLWLFTNKQANGYRRMYEESAEGMISELVKTSKSGYRYMSQISGGRSQYKMEHLTCFSGGMFAIGALYDGVTNVNEHLKLAADLTETCHESYDRTATKIGPEAFEFNSNEFGSSSSSSYYILRPEVIESYFILWRTTKEQKYRDWAWEAFQAIEKHCRVSDGYSGIKNVNQVPVVHDDTQQSFFLAETLKYLYLTFSDDDVIPLDDYIFNTEAHPLGKIRDPVSSWPADLQKLLIMS